MAVATRYVKRIICPELDIVLTLINSEASLEPGPTTRTTSAQSAGVKIAGCAEVWPAEGPGYMVCGSAWVYQLPAVQTTSIVVASSRQEHPAGIPTW